MDTFPRGSFINEFNARRDELNVNMSLFIASMRKFNLISTLLRKLLCSLLAGDHFDVKEQ